MPRAADLRARRRGKARQVRILAGGEALLLVPEPVTLRRFDALCRRWGLRPDAAFDLLIAGAWAAEAEERAGCHTESGHGVSP